MNPLDAVLRFLIVGSASHVIGRKETKVLTVTDTAAKVKITHF